MTIQKAIQTAKLAIAALEWEYPLDYCIAIEKLIEVAENGGQSKEMDR